MWYAMIIVESLNENITMFENPISTDAFPLYMEDFWILAKLFFPSLPHLF